MQNVTKAMKTTLTIIIIIFTAFYTLSKACCSIPQVVTNYRLKSNLPLPSSKTSGANLYPKFPRYGVNCGHNMYWNVSSNSGIIRGVDAFENEFPHFAAIGFGILYCGGSIINE